MQRLTDDQGRTIGYLDAGRSSDGERRVLNANHVTVGWVNDRGTFDSHRRHLSTSRIPGLLLKG